MTRTETLLRGCPAADPRARRAAVVTRRDGRRTWSLLWGDGVTWTLTDSRGQVMSRYGRAPDARALAQLASSLSALAAERAHRVTTVRWLGRDAVLAWERAGCAVPRSAVREGWR